MADSVAVFSPGFRLTDSDTGATISGAIIRFYDAGTTTPRTVYADQDLLTALGTSVTTDSLGYPTSNGTTKSLVYADTASYKVTIEDSDAVVLATHDHVKGALDTAGFGGSGAVTASFPVVTKSLDYTVLAADQNKLFAVNCSSADVTLTLPSAVTVGDGWAIQVQHAGSANQAIVATGFSQTISEGSKSYGTSFSLGLNGEEAWVISDGGNWRVTSHTTPFPKVMPIPVIDRVTAAPGTPVQGGYYLVSSAYSTFSTGDIIQYAGASYVAFTPYTDCGWTVWVADEDLYYHFRGTAWLAESASDTMRGTQENAVQSEMESASSTTLNVVPGRQQFHPSACKCWGKFNGTGTVSLDANYNTTSLTDDGTGKYTITIATDMSSANYAALADGNVAGSSGALAVNAHTLAAGTFKIFSSDNNTDTDTDPNVCGYALFGDQ